MKNKNIVHVVGARPNFVKAAPVMRGISEKIKNANQILIHTGQHYDKNLSDVFFKALDIPKPDINLRIGSSNLPGKQISDVITGVEKYLSNKKVDLVVVYGDVNSTLGATIAAVKMGIKVAHVESGLRSNDRTMPEEINRMIVDRISDYHFVTEPAAVHNLLNEGLDHHRVFHVGNTMIDSLFNVLKVIEKDKMTLELGDEDYVLMTLHRPSNVDNEAGLQKILNICQTIKRRIIFPMHPRTKNSFGKFGMLKSLQEIDNLEIIDPVGYFEFVSLMKGSFAVITDSGGVQEETTAMAVPCITLRKNTERPITISEGTNVLVDSTKEVVSALSYIGNETISGKNKKKPKLWDGNAGSRIASVIRQELSRIEFEKEKGQKDD